MNLSLAAAMVLTCIVIATIVWNIWPERIPMHDQAAPAAKSSYKGITWEAHEIIGWNTGALVPLDFLLFDGSNWVPPILDQSPFQPKAVGVYLGDNYVLTVYPPTKVPSIEQVILEKDARIKELEKEVCKLRQNLGWTIKG